MAAPINNNFADATIISGKSGQVFGTNVDATLEAGEPVNPESSGGKSVWWSWTAPSTESVTIKTDYSSFDTIMAIYTGSAIDALTLVDSDDDAGEGTRSLITFNATEGTTYKISVDGYGGASGDIILTWNTASVKLLSATAASSSASTVILSWVFLSATANSSAAMIAAHNWKIVAATAASSAAMTAFLVDRYISAMPESSCLMEIIGYINTIVNLEAIAESSSEMQSLVRNRSNSDILKFTDTATGIPYRPDAYDPDLHWDEDNGVWVSNLPIEQTGGGRFRQSLICVTEDGKVFVGL